jgi:hypothetical protein
MASCFSREAAWRLIPAKDNRIEIRSHGPRETKRMLNLWRFVATDLGGCAMNTTRLRISLMALLLCAPLAFAQAPASPPAAAGDAAAANQQMQRMQANMKNMQDMMAKIQASKDPAERQKLMQEHSKAMHAQMEMMGGMGGGQMGMMKGGDMMEGGNMMGGDMMKEHQAMQGRMAMMEMMMGQMLQHQEAAQSK